MNKIAITADSICDIPPKMLEENDIQLIYFDIKTNEGMFKDTIEITSHNIFEYLSAGDKKAESCESSPADYKKFFMQKLEEHDELIHFCLSDGVGIAVKNAMLARAQLGIEGQRIHIIDSKNLSAGMGLMVLRAASLRNEGKSCRDIINEIEAYQSKVYTSFIAYNADYLYYNGRVSKWIKELCNKLNLHPVLHMKDGKLVLKNIYFGNSEKCYKKYISSILKKNSKYIDKSKAFVVYSGMQLASQRKIEESIDKCMKFDDLYKSRASAAVSANCGPGSFGVIVSYNSIIH